CTTAADCPVTTGAPFMPSCEGDVLTTLGGSGELQCVEGQCSWDSYEEETDCAAEGKVCGYPPESGAAASACMDPPDSEE
ncbi:MAG: hypothetical protein VX938_13835, partial [Myxococcota bacterium]|nr:hypothetical protein [Myxococcota bacterium]